MARATAPLLLRARLEHDQWHAGGGPA